ncbi:YgaP family membrane protein [Mesorhizobium sp. Cs1299R1N3]|uniref:YgaP family membrane protein n=1 Tax=Mesorhizobium sp. Cs1299R1N3 TaxID=3015173 RepID=UPI00301D3D27
MFYKKNLPLWERLVRLLAAAVMGSCAAHFWGTPVGYTWAVGGVGMALTSVFGFCPMCAMAGRRIALQQKRLRNAEKKS